MTGGIRGHLATRGVGQTAGFLAAVLNGGVGLVSLLIATIGGPGNANWAGIIYLVNAPLHTIRGMVGGRRRRRLENRFAATAETPVAD
jgi:hypothetical protein